MAHFIQIDIVGNVILHSHTSKSCCCHASFGGLEYFEFVKTARMVCWLPAAKFDLMLHFNNPPPNGRRRGISCCLSPGRTHFAELLLMLVCNIAENGRKPGGKTELCFIRSVLYTQNLVEGITTPLLEHSTKKKSCYGVSTYSRDTAAGWFFLELMVRGPEHNYKLATRSPNIYNICIRSHTLSWQFIRYITLFTKMVLSNRQWVTAPWLVI